MSNNIQEQFDPKTYWEERLAKNKGLKGVGYTLLGSGYNFWAYKVRRYSFLKAYSNQMSNRMEPLKSKVLDIGSGSGFYLDIWQSKKVKNITGSDLTNTAVARLTTKYPHITIQQFDLTEPDLSSLKDLPPFEFISCMDVLFHVIEETKYHQSFKNISALLKPNGIFIFTENLVEQKTFENKHHISRTKQEINRILQENNLEILSIRPLMVLMNEPVDTKNKLLTIYWKGVASICSLSNTLGFILGAISFPIDLLLLQFIKSGPTSKLIVVQKKNAE